MGRRNEGKGLERAGYYDGEYYDRIGFTGLIGHEERYRSRAKLAKYIRRDIQPDAKVFEFGCGPGYNLLLLPNTVKEGYDLSSKGLACCRKHGLTVYDDIESVPRGVYDVVICSHVLEHVVDPVATLSVIHSLLKDGGILDLVLPVERYARIPRRFGSDVHQHLFTWSPQNIYNLLSFTSYRVESMCYLPMAGRSLFWRFCGDHPGTAMFVLRPLHFLLPREYRELRILTRKPGLNVENDKGKAGDSAEGVRSSRSP